MQIQPLISVIVPVYKAKEFLSKCINSILSQTYTNFELLLVDDGSPDNCGKICDEYASKDSRVRVFHKQNGGVSSARNLGLREARGEWITFIDADDMIKEGFLKEFGISNSIDFFISSYECSDGNNMYNVATDILLYRGDEKSEVLETLTKGMFIKTVWGKLFKTNIIRDNNIWFNDRMKVGEDTVFSINYLAYCTNLKFDSNINYIYNNNYNGNDFAKKYRLSFSNFNIHYGILNEKIKLLECNWGRSFTHLREFSKQLYYGLFLKYLLLNLNINGFIKERDKFIKQEGKIYNLRILFISVKGWKMFISNKLSAMIFYLMYKVLR